MTVLLYFLPLFHVVPLHSDERLSSLERGPGASTSPAFDPREFVERFWTERLISGVDGAVEAAQLIDEIQQDRGAARDAHGRRLGLSETYFFFLAGTGRVVSVDKTTIGLALDDDATHAQVVLETGLVFGNAVRDGTGLLDVNDFANSQQFNAISTEINRRIETDVLPPLREQATIGTTIRFAGCTQITDEETDLDPLRVVPFIGETP